MMKRAVLVFLASLLSACGGGGGSAGGGGSPGGSIPIVPQTANYFPLAVGNDWQYTGGLNYTMPNTAIVSGKMTYAYQGGCNEWEFLYKDSQQDVYSIGQNVSSPTAPSLLYPSPELIVKGSMSAGESWTNNLGFGTETLTVGAATSVTINGTSYPAWSITSTGYGESSTTIYVANFGPVFVTDFCVSPPVLRSLTSYAVSSSSI